MHKTLSIVGVPNFTIFIIFALTSHGVYTLRKRSINVYLESIVVFLYLHNVQYIFMVECAQLISKRRYVR